MIQKNDKIRIKELREKGYTLASIANIYGVSRQRIDQIIKNIKGYTSKEGKIIGKIHKKFNYKCAKCNSKYNLNIHHIDGNHSNTIENNLILLCNKCHNYAHRKYKKCIMCGEENVLNKKHICKNCKIKEMLERKKKWSLKYEKCIICGTTKVEHKSMGKCSNCYSKYLYNNNINGRRDKCNILNKKWQKNNPEKWKIISRKATNKYYLKKKQENKKILEDLQNSKNH